MRKLYAVLLASTLLLGACATAETPAQKVFAATSTYNVALAGAVAYKKLPDCSSTTVKICSDKEAVVTIQKADIVAFEALSSAQTIVRNPVKSQTALQTAALWAKEAVAAFTSVVNSLKK